MSKSDTRIRPSYSEEKSKEAEARERSRDAFAYEKNGGFVIASTLRKESARAFESIGLEKEARRQWFLSGYNSATIYEIILTTVPKNFEAYEKMSNHSMEASAAFDKAGDKESAKRYRDFSIEVDKAILTTRWFDSRNTKGLMNFEYNIAIRLVEKAKQSSDPLALKRVGTLIDDLIDGHQALLEDSRGDIRKKINKASEEIEGEKSQKEKGPDDSKSSDAQKNAIVLS